MPRTNLDALQRIQTKGLRLVLGVPRCIRIDDLHAEANLPPLQVRYELLTALHAEKYRRFPPDDPMYHVAHQSLRPLRLKRSSWQYESDKTLQRVGLFASRQYDPSPCPRQIIPLFLHREGLPFYGSVAPWDLEQICDRLSITPTISGIRMNDPAPHRKARALEEISKLREDYDFSFWTDGSFLPLELNRPASSVCIGHACIGNPTARQTIETWVAAQPAGLLSSGVLAERGALHLIPVMLLRFPDFFRHKHIFVGSDSQAALTGLINCSGRPPSFANIDWSQTLELLYRTASQLECKMDLHYIPSHVGIEGNETVDYLANMYVRLYSTWTQQQVGIPMSSLKTHLTRSLFGQWRLRLLDHRSPRFHIVGVRPSQLKHRSNIDRMFQCTFSQWRLGYPTCAGRYPRFMQWIDQRSCRFCGFYKETALHLLTDCPGTSVYRVNHGLSLMTLRIESSTNILSLALFDLWIRQVFPNDRLPDHDFAARLNQTLQKRKAGELSSPVRPPPKRRRLIVYHHGLPRNLIHKRRQQPPIELLKKKRRKQTASSKDTRSER